MSFISMDFDETYTAHPSLFDVLISAAQSKGVHILFCTARHNRAHDDNQDIEKDSKTTRSGNYIYWK